MIPAKGEEAEVTPVMTQVSEVTVQLSAKVGSVVKNEALHTPASEFLEMAAGQVVKVGGTSSFTAVVITADELLESTGSDVTDVIDA